VKFRRILKVLCLQGLQRRLWTNFHDFCVPKQSCLLSSSHTLWKFSPCKPYKKSCGCMFTIYASKNEAVCCEVQTPFGSSLPACFAEQSFGCNFRYQKTGMKRSTKATEHYSKLHIQQCLKHAFCNTFWECSNNYYLTLWCPLRFGDIRKKTPKRTWLCTGISPVWYALQTR